MYVDYNSLHQQTRTRNLLDRIASRAPDTVRGFDGLFAHFKHQFWHLSSCTIQGCLQKLEASQVYPSSGANFQSDEFGLMPVTSSFYFSSFLSAAT